MGLKQLSVDTSGLVAKAGTETITGAKRFNGGVGIGAAADSAFGTLRVVRADAGNAIDVLAYSKAYDMRHDHDHVGAVADLTNLYHKSTGDALFAAHQGGVVAATSFTANTTNGSPTLASISAMDGLTTGIPITGAGIPASTYVGTVNAAGSSVTMVDAAGAAVNATATASGVTVSVAASGTPGGNAIFNGLVPYHIDDTTTGKSGTVLNTRTGMVGMLIQTQAPRSGVTGIILKHHGNGPALQIDNQAADQAIVGTGGPVVITDASDASGITISKTTTPAAGKATLALNTTVASAIDALRVNDSAGAGRLLVRADGTTTIGANYPSNTPLAVKLQVWTQTAGIQRMLALNNNGTANGDGAQLEFLTGQAQNALVQGVMDDTAANNGSLRLQAKQSGTLREYVRLDGVNDRVSVLRGSLLLSDGIPLSTGTVTGSKIGTATSQKLGFWNATPIVQPSRAGQLTDSSGGTSGGATIGAVSDVATAANAIATLAAKYNALEAKLSAAGGGSGITA